MERVGTLDQNFRTNTFSFSLVNIMLIICLSNIAFTMLMYVPATTNFFRIFFMNFCQYLLNFNNSLLYIHCCDLVVSFKSTHVLSYSSQCTCIVPILHPWNGTNLIHTHDLNVFLNPV